MRNSLFVASLLTLTVAVAPACATKKYVRTEVGNVNSKVDTLAGTVEETQERTRKNEARIGVVDEKAEAAGRSATSARTAADAAAGTANAAVAATKDVDNRLGGRINAVDAATRRLVFEVTLSEDQGNFAFGKAELPDPAKARLDDLVRQVKAEPKNIFIEIEGHTDNIGTTDVNERVGFERAEAVKKYLYEQHQVPLHKMNVISYGEDKPVAPNNNRDGRAQNRRVVVKVLS